MAQFNYTALSRDGAKVSGVIEGYDELDAASRIKENCDVILKLAPVQKQKIDLLHLDLSANRLNERAFTVMCSQFAIILESGIPIARAVQLVADKTDDKNLRRVMKKVAVDVEGGRSLSSAFEDHGAKMLPITFIETLRAGEATGNLAHSFQTMQVHFEKQNETKKKVKSALSYPIFILITALIVVGFLMGSVVPKFTVMFDDLGAELPGMTKALIAVSNFFKNYSLLVLAGIAVIILGFKLYGSRESGKLKLAKAALKVPILGKIRELSAASQFANSMASMMSAGLTMDRAVSITAKVIDNYYLAKQTNELAKMLETGQSLGASMRESTDYPDILVDMTGVGENSGEMEKTLTTIGRYYDSELDEAIRSALSKLEPSILVGIAGIAGFIVIAIYMAIFSMYGAMGSV
ncbi:MAG: type II secretion system F family protein [Oscillospiraceae bacterium]|nr:type II secretion system F family protein [Oscillospiraceae bacterium]